MPQTPPLAVELWECILRYTIGVPDFLDPDAFEGILSEDLLDDQRDGASKEALYWIAERDRQSLQRVCKSWYTYLRPFQHRFVRILDIWHKKIPLSSLKYAVRLSVGRYHCECREFCGPELDKRKLRQGCIVTPPSYRDAFFSPVFWRFLLEAGPLNGLGILDLMGEPLELGGLVQVAQNVQEIKTLLGLQDCILNNHARYSLITFKLPNLRHLYCHDPWTSSPDWGFGTMTQPLLSQTIPLGPNILTLFLKIDRFWKDDDYILFQRGFPSLRHLRIECHSWSRNHETVEDMLLPLLKGANNLISLSLESPGPEHIMPVEVWDLCPKLERLGVVMLLNHPPRPSHPLNTLIILCSGFWEESPIQWPQLERVVVDWLWNYPLHEAILSEEWFQQASKRGLRIEDLRGLTWAEYMIWREHTSNRPKTSLQTNTSRFSKPAGFLQRLTTNGITKIQNFF